MFEEIGILLNNWNPLLWALFAVTILSPVVFTFYYFLRPKGGSSVEKQGGVSQNSKKREDAASDSGIEASGETGAHSRDLSPESFDSDSGPNTANGTSPHHYLNHHKQQQQLQQQQQQQQQEDTGPSFVNGGVATASKSLEREEVVQMNGGLRRRDVRSTPPTEKQSTQTNATTTSTSSSSPIENGVASAEERRAVARLEFGTANQAEIGSAAPSTAAPPPEEEEEEEMEVEEEEEEEESSHRWSFPPVLEDFDLMESDVDPSQLEEIFADERLVEVKLRVEPSGPGVGITIVGGINSPSGDLPLLVKRVLPGSLAEASGVLKPADELVAVNETLLVGTTKDFAASCLSKMEGDVRLLVLQDY